MLPGGKHVIVVFLVEQCVGGSSFSGTRCVAVRKSGRLRSCSGRRTVSLIRLVRSP